MTADGYLRPAQAAAYLGIKQRTLIEWRRQGRGPRYSRFGGSPQGRVRYARADLDAYMRRQLVSA